MKTLNKLILLSLVVLVAGSLTSCDDDENDSSKPSSLTLNLSGLEDLGSGYAYEGWIIVDGSPVTTGTFTVDADGKLSATSFEVDADQLAAATNFVLSIEPSPDSDPAPADTKLLIGEFSGNSATVSTGTVSEGDFTASTGEYIVAAPTASADLMGATYSGIWFLNNESMPMVAGLDLPELAAGWKYEGWVVIDGVPVSTGTFTAVDEADDASPHSDGGPAFPGEDFLTDAPSTLTFPTDIRGGAAVISIEPSPDNSAAPFALKPLLHSIPEDAAAGTVLTMGNNTNASFPSGTVTR
ncbi:anti-sigma factor [Reichenbachiella versicolor]|uniref:anti-sigma factor n=1 Tax=Reichenbachiella versicolor TaxID=1821036 RepID=UPI001C86F927|nr:anti-sigma factor [Reichenbachiella versicolor]